MKKKFLITTLIVCTLFSACGKKTEPVQAVVTPTPTETVTPTEVPTVSADVPTVSEDIVEPVPTETDMGMGITRMQTEDDLWYAADGQEFKDDGWLLRMLSTVKINDEGKAEVVILPFLTNSWTGEYYVTEAEKEYEDYMIGHLDYDYNTDELIVDQITIVPGSGLIYFKESGQFEVDGEVFKEEDGWKCRLLLDPSFTKMETRYAAVLYKGGTDERYIPVSMESYTEKIDELWSRKVDSVTLEDLQKEEPEESTETDSVEKTEENQK